MKVLGLFVRKDPKLIVISSFGGRKYDDSPKCIYEEMLNEMEGTKPTFNEKIRIAEVREYDYDLVCKQIDELIDIAKQYDNMATVAKMKEIVPEYKSNNSIYVQLD